MSLSLVDGKGHQVPLLQGAPPSSLAYEEIDALTDLKSCIATQTFDLKPDSKKPGNLLLIRSTTNTSGLRLIIEIRLQSLFPTKILSSFEHTYVPKVDNIDLGKPEYITSALYLHNTCEPCKCLERLDSSVCSAFDF